jgi:hypothetical protein
MKKAATKAHSPKSRRAPRVASLGAGAHFARLNKQLSEGRFEAVLFADGKLIEVSVAPEVDLALAERCLAESAVVLLGMRDQEAMVFGALQTKERSVDEARLEGTKSVVLRAGQAKLELSADGKIKVSGRDVTIDAPREVRVVTARMEIP